MFAARYFPRRYFALRYFGTGADAGAPGYYHPPRYAAPVYFAPRYFGSGGSASPAPGTLTLTPTGLELLAEGALALVDGTLTLDTDGLEVTAEQGQSGTELRPVVVGQELLAEFSPPALTASITPAGQELLAELGIVVVTTAGSLTIVPTGVELTAELGAALVQAGLLPAGVEVVTEQGTTTLTARAVPDGVELTAELATPTLQAALAVLGLELVAEFGPPVVNTGNTLTLAVQGVELSAELGSPALTGAFVPLGLEILTEFTLPVTGLRDLALGVTYQSAPRLSIRRRVMVTVPLDNDWDYEVALTQKDATTRATEAATGLTGLTMCFAERPDAAPLAGTSLPLVEAPGLPGTYTATLDRGALTAALTPYIGRRVFEILEDNQAVRTARPLIVRAVRAA